MIKTYTSRLSLANFKSILGSIFSACYLYAFLRRDLNNLIVNKTQQEVMKTLEIINTCLPIKNEYVAYAFKRSQASYSAGDAYLQHLKARLGDVFRENIIDLGSGLLYETIYLRRFSKSILALDRRPEVVILGKALLKSLGMTGISMRIGDATRTNLDSMSFSAINCNVVVQDCSLWLTLLESHRLLKPGGMMYISALGEGYIVKEICSEVEAGNREGAERRLRQLADGILYCSSDDLFPITEVHPRMFYSRNNLISFAKKAGYSVVKDWTTLAEDGLEFMVALTIQKVENGPSLPKKELLQDRIKIRFAERIASDTHHSLEQKEIPEEYKVVMNKYLESSRLKC